MKTDHSKQGQSAGAEKKNASKPAPKQEANSKMLKGDVPEKDEVSEDKFEGTLRHKEGDKDK